MMLQITKVGVFYWLLRHVTREQIQKKICMRIGWIYVLFFFSYILPQKVETKQRKHEILNPFFCIWTISDEWVTTKDTLTTATSCLNR